MKLTKKQRNLIYKKALKWRDKEKNSLFKKGICACLTQNSPVYAYDEMYEFPEIMLFGGILRNEFILDSLSWGQREREDQFIRDIILELCIQMTE